MKHAENMTRDVLQGRDLLRALAWLLDDLILIALFAPAYSSSTDKTAFGKPACRFYMAAKIA